MKLKQVPITDLDYIQLYAEKLKENPKLFKQQKDLIESQLLSGAALVKKRFSNGDFKTQARIHLKEIGVI
jgi:hypothetical protein